MAVAPRADFEYLRVAFAVTNDPMLIVDADSVRIVDANPAYCRMCGFDPEQLFGQLLSEFVTGSIEAPNEAHTAATGLGSVNVKRADLTFIAANARRYHCSPASDADWLLVFTPFGSNPPQGVTRDSLTGLLTRDEFDRRVAACLERVRRHGPPFFAVLFLDLDDFKPVNDRFGHAMGDRVLAAIAERLTGAIRPGDLLSRRGGDEFTLLVDGIHSADEALHIAERLVSRSREPLLIEGQALNVSMSVGVAFAGNFAEAAADLIAEADRAMYEAKRQGAPVLYPAGR